jgi:hypothetical protein
MAKEKAHVEKEKKFCGKRQQCPRHFYMIYRFFVAAPTSRTTRHRL